MDEQGAVRGDDEPLLSVHDLEQHYPVTEGLFDRRVGTVRAVDGVSLAIPRGETLGLVGESGCGKSTLARTILRLEEPTAGSIRFDGEDVTALDDRELKRFRRDAQLVLQDPDSSFDPRMRVGESVTEPLRIHGVSERDRRRKIGLSAIDRVGLSAADYDRYPHEFSGGQRQRLALARALVVGPRLLVADEPVSALDVSVQSGILSLLADLQDEMGLSVLLISHDLRVVEDVCDRVAVMYAGEIVEEGPTGAVFAAPKHPYTEALLSAIPEPDPTRRDRGVRLSGDVPDPSKLPSGCRFHPRCPSVLQPDGVDVEQSTWRGLLDLRDRLSGDDVDRRSLRDDLEGLKPIRDDAVRAAVREAIGALEEDDFDGAVEALESVVRTPCEREQPDQRPIDVDHVVACHLYDPSGDVVAPEAAGAITAAEFEWVGDRDE